MRYGDPVPKMVAIWGPPEAYLASDTGISSATWGPLTATDESGQVNIKGDIKVKAQFPFLHLELSLRMATEIAQEMEVESQEEAARATS